MKGTIKTKKSFERVDITLENEEELMELFCLMNFTPITDSCPTANKLYSLLHNLISGLDMHAEYGEPFKKITTIIKRRCTEVN